MRPRGPQPSVTGRWIIAKTLIAARYPCRCYIGRDCNPQYCPCHGRPDTTGLPELCCARPTDTEPTP